jgi:signal transduction histidine kinase
MKPVRVLFVEDSADDALLVERALARAGWQPTCDRVETEAAFRAALQGRPVDLVVSDWVLPSFSGRAALAIARTEAPEVPFIVCSGKIDEETAVTALRSGAKDFVTKGNLARLGPAVERELREAAERRERRRVDQEVLRLRAELERSRRLEEVGTIASQVSHDLRNLLTPIVLLPDQLRLRLEPGHPARPLCDKLQQGLRRLAGVTEDLLTLGRRAQLRLEEIDLNLVVREALDGLREPPSTLSLDLSLAPDLPRVAGAPGQLARALANLLTNAREAMGDRGRLEIRTSGLDLAAPRGPLGPGRHAVVEVADSGCGFAPEVAERIFEPFYSTKAGGTCSGSGLGLAIVQAIVSDHQGTVSVSSEVGRGTRFTVCLPASPGGSQPRHGEARR